MRKSKAETVASRRDIVEQAGRLFREYGPDRVSVADVMAAAGMTHGGFYKHFNSKDALFAAALETVFAERLQRLTDLSDGDPIQGLAGYLDTYFLPGHVENRAFGCPIAGLTGDALRQSPEAAATLGTGSRAILEKFAAALGNEDEAIRILSLAIGAVILARAVQNNELKQRILHIAARETDPGSRK
jgi:TetR/AcrR family transcriptional repressor of nem operon